MSRLSLSELLEYLVFFIMVLFVRSISRPFQLNGTGMAEFHVKTDQVKLPVESVWFPNGGRLYLEADVTEEASGKVEHAIDQSVVFAETAYVFKFTRSSRFFKPGLPYILRVSYMLLYIYML